MKCLSTRLIWLCFFAALPAFPAEILISEIMFHPSPEIPEDKAREWIEIHNASTNEVNISGWRFAEGVEFTFPSNTVLNPGGYLVVAANLAAFQGQFPGVANVVGDWIGQLSNNGEEIRLEDAQGEEINAVRYADAGEWAVRQRVPDPTQGRPSWDWLALADGQGPSLELINTAVPNSSGQNWSPSFISGGTPGSANSAATADSAPLILDTVHFPVVPTSTDNVTITARLVDQSPAGITASVFYRNASSSLPPGFSEAPMFDDGAHNDGLAGDGLYGAVLLPQGLSGTVVEFYVRATDGANVRTWPAPALDGVQLQIANVQYQVDDSVYGGTQPFIRLVLTGAERQTLQNLNNTPGSDAQVNVTMVIKDGIGTEVRYLSDMRIRGAGSRGRPTKNYRVNIPSDRPWNGLTAINLNVQYPHAQLVGSVVAQKAGLPAANARVVQVRINGENLARSGPPVAGDGASWGSYVLVEPINNEWAARIFPNDDNGNVYRASSGNHLADLSYQGEDPSAYISRGYSKTSNQSEYDWSDLANLTLVLNNTPDASYTAAVNARVNVREWMTYFAAFTLMEYSETALGQGEGDDYSLYRGILDTRFQIVGHDFDTIFGQGDTGGNPNESIWLAADVDQPAVDRFLKWPEFAPIYFETLLRLANSSFSAAQLNPLFDQYLNGLATEPFITAMKSFAAARVVGVLNQIPRAITITSTLPVTSGYPRTTTPNVALSGFANAIRTRSVQVNGVLATWTAWRGAWSVSNIPLTPGINRVLVQSFDSQGAEFERSTIDIWYDDSSITDVLSDIVTDTVWTAANGPYRVTSSLEVLATLTIEPGTTVYFGTGANLAIAGRLVAEGTERQPIRFTRQPGTAVRWNGINLSGTSLETRIVHAHVEFNDTTAIHSTDSALFLDHVTFGSTDRQYLAVDRSSFVVRDCVFPSATAQFELVHGTGGIKAGGRGIFLRNYFGVPIAYNDVVDFTGGNRPGPIIQFINNVFTGATDDILDLDSTDAWVEGNIFLHVHKNNSPDSASAISGGADNADTSQITVIGNIFYDCDQAANAKQGNFYTLINNTIVHQTRQGGTDTDAGVVILSDDGGPEGAGIYLEGNIIYDAEKLVRNQTASVVTFTNNLMSLPWSGPGGGNSWNVPPLFKHLPTLAETTNFTSWAQAQVLREWFSLQAGSPARGAGPNQRDQGGVIPLGASISGEPIGVTAANSATLTVGVNRTGNGIPVAGFPNGSGYTHYRWRLDGGSWSAETPIAAPISLTGLAAGPHYVEVTGRRDSAFYQDDAAFAADAVVTRSRTWTVNPSLADIRLNEVLARNVSALGYQGGFPDAIEIYNAGGASVDLSGWGLSDEQTNRFKFKFPADTVIPSGQYLIVYADELVGLPGLHSGFGLNDAGDTLYLHNPAAVLVDSIEFGVQLPDLSIGRASEGAWTLCRPTLGAANIPHPLSDPYALKINEWLANGATLYPDDFIEIYNPSPAPVLLGGLHLTDEPLGWPGRHRVVPLTFLGAGSHFVFLADADPEEGASHVDFKLSAIQGAIGLFDAATNLIDCVFYGPQVTDRSEGRRPSGASAIGPFNIPTPGAPNPGTGGGSTVSNITINLLPFLSDWRYDRSNTDLGTAWRATNYNDSAWQNGPAPLGRETDAIPIPVQTVFPNYNAQQIIYYFRTTFVVNSNYADFNLALNAELDDGAVIYLNGREVARPGMGGGTIFANTLPITTVQNATVEIVQPGANAITNLVQGLNYLAVEVHNNANPDSSDLVWALELNVTKSITNEIPVGVTLNEIMARNLSFTNAGGTNLADWVELYNPSTSTINLSDMSLSDQLANPRRWVFPAGVTLAPGTYLVVRFDSTSPGSTNAGPLLNTGFGLDGNEGDAVYVFDAPARLGVLLDSITFGVQVLDYSIGRAPDGTGKWGLTLGTPGSANIAAALGNSANLKVNEWLASPSGNNDDFLELYNPNPQPVDLSGLYLTDTLTNRTQSPIRTLSFIGTGDDAFVLFIADGNPQNGADHVDFNLRAAGESVALFSRNEVLIDSYTFTQQENGVSEGRFPDGSTNIVRFRGTTTPGRSNLLPLETVAINEVLTHTDPPLEDAIELRNVSSAAVDLSGWYLSDRRNDPKRFRIPPGTILNPGGFLVFYEYQFNPDFSGRPPYFSLDSAEGEELFLFTADSSGNLTGFRTSANFGAAENAVSFGRHPTSIGFDFTAMSQRTFGMDTPATVEQLRTGTGLSNAYPRVGPIVIHEIMYHPPDMISGNVTNDNEVDEFIELRNISGADVPLFHPDFPTNTWRLRDAVDFNFPPNLTLPAGGYLLVVSFNPTNTALLTAFRNKYSISAAVPVFGPWQGRLANDQENIELYKPDVPQPAGSPDPGFVPYIEMDRVKYADTQPWAPLADGNPAGVGMSLQKNIASNYGNDPVNWVASTPTPGGASGPGGVTPPAISSITPPLELATNASSSLTVTATGAATLTYQWRFNGAVIPGAISPTLFLSNFQNANAGVYSVVVANNAGSASASTRVDLRSLPFIVRQPQNQLAPTNGTAVFTVVAGGTQPLHYQWRKNTTDILGANAPSLVLQNVQVADAVNYRVVITNVYGAITSLPAALDIISAPVIVSQPQSTNAFVSQTVSFQVNVFGSPPLQYQWRFNGANIANATNPILTLANLQLTHAGTYSVRVTNAIGSVLSDSVTLNVAVAPTITILATDTTAGESGGDFGVFTISRSGSLLAPQVVHFTVSGNAVPGSDYLALTSPITISAGSSSRTVLVNVVDDSLHEGNETVTVTLTPGPDYIAGPPAIAMVIIRDDDNLAPSVTLTNPVNDQVIHLGTPIVLGASAVDPDGSVAKVAFYDYGTNLIGESTSLPFNFMWTNAAPGAHVLTAVATDNLGSTGDSLPVSIIVNAVPSVAITTPANGSVINANGDATLTATASDTDGTVTLVEFYRDATLLGSDASSPYSIVWTNVPVGSFVLTARATDNRGGTRVSAPVNVSAVIPPPGFSDNFANRGLITGYTNFTRSTNTTFTVEPGEPRHDNRNGTHSGWLSWTAPSSGVCTMDTFGSSFDTVIGVYTGTVVSNLFKIASNDDANANTTQSRVVFDAVAGTAYQIAVDGYAANAFGSIVFRMNLPNLNPVITSQPQSLAVSPGASAMFSVTATASGTLSYQWRLNGAPISGATGTSYTRSNVQHVDGGSYSVLVSSSTGSTTSQSAELGVRPVLFPPQVLNGNVQLSFNGVPNRMHAVEASATGATWTPLNTNLTALVQKTYTDNGAGGQTTRMYRVRVVQ
jgi:hypothetical protein